MSNTTREEDDVAINSEQLVCEWFTSSADFSGIAVGLDVAASDPRPERFITVERTGGGISLRGDYPTLMVEAWGTSRDDARQLADQAAKLLIASAQNDPQVGRLTIDGIKNAPDKDNEGNIRQSRYQITFHIHINKFQNFQ
jgi:hypothetical protein